MQQQAASKQHRASSRQSDGTGEPRDWNPDQVGNRGRDMVRSAPGWLLTGETRCRLCRTLAAIVVAVKQTGKRPV